VSIKRTTGSMLFLFHSPTLHKSPAYILEPCRGFLQSIGDHSFSCPDTHPSRLAVMAILHGLKPAPVEKCCVLDVEWNEGGNLPTEFATRPLLELSSGTPSERTTRMVLWQLGPRCAGVGCACG